MQKKHAPVTRRVSYPVQIVVFALLFGAATLLWLGRERVTSIYLAATGAGEAAEMQRRRPAPSAVPVVVERVRRMASDAVIAAIATARAKQSVTLYPKTTGEIVELRVSAGDRVKDGDVILRLNTQMATLAVDIARSKFADAERQLERAEKLRATNVNSQARVEDAANTSAQAKFELEQAEESLRERTLLAPFDGVVGIPKVQLGDRVTPETSIVTLDDRSILLVEIEVPEQYLARVDLDLNVTARSPSFPQQTFEGVVAEIDSRIDPVTRAMMVRVGLNNEDDMLRPGMSFAVNLPLPGDDYPTVPELAVQWRSGESFVWVVRDSKAERVIVRSVKRLRSFILIEGAVSEGELVVIEGVHRLREGAAISFVQPDLPQSGES